MTGPCSRSRFRWLRRFCFLLCLFVGCCSVPAAHPQDLDKPLQTIDEDITAFAFSPDGRIVYSVRRMFRSKKYDLQRDDIWIQEANGKRRRLLNGEKFIRGDAPFTYAVALFRFSPNSHLILTQLSTTSVVDESGLTANARMTLFLDDTGRELRIGSGDNVLKDSRDATWLLDNATVVYLTEEMKLGTLFSFRYVNIGSGPVGKVFEGRTFLDSVPIQRSNSAIAIERNPNFSGPARLQRLELLSQDDQELATLDNYNGGLSVSPSGQRAAYYIDKEILEVRDLSAPQHVARLRVGLGVLQWAPGEDRLLLKRATERKSGDLVWFDIPPLAAPPQEKDVPVVQPTPQPVLHGLTFRDFAISPDGRFLAVITTGKHSLLVFPLPAR